MIDMEKALRHARALIETSSALLIKAEENEKNPESAMATCYWTAEAMHYIKAALALLDGP